MTEIVIASSVLILAVIAVRFLFRSKISRRFQYALWGLVLLRLLLPFSPVQSGLSVMNGVPSVIERAGTGLSASDAYAGTLSPAQEEGKQPVVTGRNPLSAGGDGAEKAAPAAFPLSEPEAKAPDAAAVLKIIWIAGGGTVALWFAFVNVSFYVKLRKSRAPYSGAYSPPLRTFTADGLSSPCLFGLFRPAVYLTPSAASEEAFPYVFAHEYCHYRHGDHIWTVLRGLCLAIYWWNPLVWAAAILSRADSELACDEAVIGLIGADSRIEYGKTLVGMISEKKTPSDIMCSATTMAGGRRAVKERLYHIVRNGKTAVPALIAAILIIAVAAGCTFTGAKSENAVNSDGAGISATAPIEPDGPYETPTPETPASSPAAEGASVDATAITYRLGGFPLESKAPDGSTEMYYLTSITLRENTATFSYIGASGDMLPSGAIPDAIAVAQDGQEWTLNPNMVTRGFLIFECAGIPYAEISSVKIWGIDVPLGQAFLYPPSEDVFMDRLDHLSEMDYSELFAYCAGSDGAYAEGVFSEMAKRFIADPGRFAAQLMMPAYPIGDDYKSSLADLGTDTPLAFGFDEATEAQICLYVLYECTPEERTDALETLESSDNEIIRQAYTLFASASEKIEEAT